MKTNAFMTVNFIKRQQAMSKIVLDEVFVLNHGTVVPVLVSLKMATNMKAV